MKKAKFVKLKKGVNRCPACDKILLVVTMNGIEINHKCKTSVTLLNDKVYDSSRAQTLTVKPEFESYV